MDQKPKRISVACDFCRNKKIKCDGRCPCSNCLQFKNDSCNYSERTRKRKRTKTGGLGSLTKLDSRLTRLESILGTLADKLEPVYFKPLDDDDHQEKKIRHEEKKISIVSSKEIHDKMLKPSSRDADVAGYSDSDLSSLFEPSPSPGSDTHQLDEKQTEDCAEMKYPLRTRFELYLGSHSILSILLGNSLDHLVYFLKPEDHLALTPLRNLPTLFHLRMTRNLALWHRHAPLDPKSRPNLFLRPFPNEPDLILLLIKNYYPGVPLASSVCETDDVYQLFETYFKQKSHRFKASELFIMAAAVCLAITCKFSEEAPTSTPSNEPDPEIPPQVAAEFSKLEKLKRELSANCVIYYFRLLIWADGFEAIQAFLLWIMYIELHEVTPFVNFIILAVTIRHGHEQGLHRAEALDELPLHMRIKRKRVWNICLYLDMEMSFRQGKSPINNLSDILLLSVSLAEYQSIKTQPTSFFDTIMDRKLLIQTVPSTNFEFYHTALLVFTKIRARSYSEMFAANVHFDNFGDFIYKLSLLNDEMFALADLMGNYRPKFYHDEPYGGNSVGVESIPSCYAVFHMNFFSHLMTINRLPFMIEDIDNPTVDVSQFRNYTLDSARTILMMCRQFSVSKHSFWNDWAYWFPISAFVCLARMCLNRPSRPETLKDIKLLVDSCMVISSYKKDGSGTFFKYNGEKDILTSLMLRLILRVVVCSIESNTNHKVVDEKTRQYLENTKKICPELFLDSEEFLKIGRTKGWEVVSLKGPSISGSQGAGQWNSPRTSPSLMNILDQLDSASDYNAMDYWDDAMFHSMLPMQNSAPQQSLMFDNGL